VAANRDLPRGHHHRLRDGGPELATARRARFGDANDIHFAAGPFTAFIAEASQRFNIPENWIRAGDAHRERRRLTRRFAQGRNGLMQIMPRTYAGLRARHHLGPDAYNPRDNILAGAAYLREMFDRYGAPGFLAAYNAGPTRYDEHLATGGPLPRPRPISRCFHPWSPVDSSTTEPSPPLTSLPDQEVTRRKAD
jgi:hypothetical protein